MSCRPLPAEQAVSQHRFVFVVPVRIKDGFTGFIDFLVHGTDRTNKKRPLNALPGNGFCFQ
jgi:hypothetical protein